MDLFWMMTAVAATIGLAMAITARVAPRLAARLFLGLAGAALAGVIAWAFRTGDAHNELDVILSLPWGVTTFVDLYLGFALMAVVIFAFERKLASALFWSVPLFVLGNVWAAAWLVVRLPTLMKRVRAGCESETAKPDGAKLSPQTPIEDPAPATPASAPD